MGVYQDHKATFPCDDEMIPVITELRKLGLETISCCSGHLNEPDRRKKAKTQLAFYMSDADILIHEGKNGKLVVSLNWLREGGAS